MQYIQAAGAVHDDPSEDTADACVHVFVHPNGHEKCIQYMYVPFTSPPWDALRHLLAGTAQRPATILLHVCDTELYGTYK
jgi:hypothetical protein